MLWYKAWLETRWQFYLSLLLLTSGSASAILGFPAILGNRSAALKYSQHQFAGSESLEPVAGSLARDRVAERAYRAYVGMYWFADTNTLRLWSLLAIIIGFHGTSGDKANGTVSFTLSLPVSRRRLLSIRAATGAIETVIVFVLPSLLIPLLASVVGARYSVQDATVYALVIAAAGMVFYSASFLLATSFSSLWPAVIGYLLFIVLQAQLQGSSGIHQSIAIDALSNQSSGRLLVRIGLLVCCALGLIYLSIRQFRRQDF